MRRTAAALAATAIAAALTGCGSARRVGPIQRVPSSIAHAAGGRPAHIAVLLMENEEYGDVIGSGQAPYVDRLARRYASAERLFAITHPSLPNYLALTGGSTFGIDYDCDDCSIGARSLVDQLSTAHISWRAYIEGLPDGCRSADTDLYARKHNPFFYFTRVRNDPSRCRRVVPFLQLRADVRSRTLPTFMWITPNLCHDGHDCSLAVGDRFLAGLLPSLLRALGPRGLLILTWDEGTSDDGCCRLAAGGHVPAILAGGLARPGARLRSPADHYSILQAIEDLLGLPRLRGAACACTPTLQPLLK